jgi:ribosome maturation factor RimP
MEMSDVTSGRKPTFLLESMSSAVKQAVVEKIQEIADRVGASEGIEIVEVQLLGGGNQRLVRIYIDKPEGVSHGDCELVSQQVGTILDVEDVVPGERYTLEVSSPGVERRLSKPKDFERFTGHKVKLVLREPVENQRRWEGTLAGFADDTITLEVAPGRSLCVPLAKVEKANLKFEW